MDILPGILDISTFDVYNSGVSFDLNSGVGVYSTGFRALLGDMSRFKYSCFEFFQILLGLRLDVLL